MARGLGRSALAAAVLAAIASPVSAHHAMDARLPTTFVEGLLSGLAHPVIGPDHLAFIVGMGIAAAMVQGGAALIVAFLAASTLGVFVHVGALTVPLAETLVAGSVIVAGGFIVLGRRAGASLWMLLAALAGLVHGYAFGESIVGAEHQVLGAYLAGLAIVSAVIASGVMAATRAFVARRPHPEAHLRTVGAMLGCAGLVMLAGVAV